MKVKVYLDTNIIFGLFKNFILRKNFIPWKIWFLRNNSNRIEAYTSSLAISEAVSEIVKIAEKEKIKVNEKDVDGIVKRLVEYCGVKILSKVEMSDLVLFTVHKIDVKDSLHLEISKRNNMILITDDVELKERGRYFYSKIMGFYEFVKMVLGPPRVELGSRPCKGRVLADRLWTLEN